MLPPAAPSHSRSPTVTPGTAAPTATPAADAATRAFAAQAIKVELVRLVDLVDPLPSAEHGYRNCVLQDFQRPILCLTGALAAPSKHACNIALSAMLPSRVFEKKICRSWFYTGQPPAGNSRRFHETIEKLEEQERVKGKLRKFFDVPSRVIHELIGLTGSCAGQPVTCCAFLSKKEPLRTADQLRQDALLHRTKCTTFDEHALRKALEAAAEPETPVEERVAAAERAATEEDKQIAARDAEIAQLKKEAGEARLAELANAAEARKRRREAQEEELATLRAAKAARSA